MSLKRLKQLKFVSPSALLEESRHVQLLFITIGFIVVMLFLLIVWACFTPINETTIAFGQVEPSSRISMVEHFEGGTVVKVLVDNGQEVKKGEPLVMLDAAGVKSQYDELVSHRTSIEFDLLRLRAFIDSNSPDKTIWLAAITKHPQISVTKLDELYAKEVELLHQQNQNRQDQKEVLQSQVDKFTAELEKNQSNKKFLEKNLDLYKKELIMLQKVVAKGYVSQREFLITQRRVTDAESELDALNGKINYAASELNESKQRLQQLDAKLAEETSEKMDTLLTELPEVNFKINAMKHRLDSLVIKAPVTGQVSNLVAKSGSTIKPGEQVLEIVPDNEKLIIAAQINTKDIGYLNIGDPAKIKVLTYDFARFGSIGGVLEKISASTFTAQNGTSFYKIVIVPDKNYVGDNKAMTLKTGMAVQTEIITGRKTVMQYLLRPLYYTAYSSLQEK
ncbi:MAG: hypothetical protein A3E87_00350 [Gammaproteobacteria bacterium RIFCSPHIGHO2_12_FULL_35_23]|nr:MAG: hypothetical protein A3E87_00350 [Gammaproteobacteria bacterium RIFCSPHIGHO2_12_FULL_35_23]